MSSDNIVKFLKQDRRYKHQTDWETMCREIIRAGEATDIPDNMIESGLSFLRDHLR